jgi:peptidoglycan/xylan/chitin deacetylase (PgdA/CDA1 family)
VGRLSGVPVILSSRRDLGYQLKKKHIWAYRVFNRFFTKIISVSEAVKEEVVRREWTNPDKVKVIYNGVDCRQQSYGEVDVVNIKKSLGVEPYKKVIGMIGAFRPIKGHIYLVKAVAELAKTEKDFVVLIVGYKETEYYEVVRQLIKRLKLEKYFICTGDRNDVTRIIAAFDIFVLPSISEGFSNAVLEAMAAGKPVVVTDGGGSPEGVIQNKTGVLVPSGNTEALSAAITRLLHNEGLRRSMGREGQIRAKEVFSLNKMLDNSEDLYEFLVRSNNHNKICLKTKAHYAVKKSVKLFLSYLLYYMRITSAYKKAFPENLKVLAYHSINSVTLGHLEMENDVCSFERQMAYLKDNYRILSLDEFLECEKNGGKYPDNSVMVTFDDGYRDNYLNAYPVLRKYNMPAVVFIAIKPLETGEPLFFDALWFAIVNTSRKVLDLSDFGLKKYVIDTTCNYVLANVIKDIRKSSMGMDSASRERLLRIIYDRLQVDLEAVKQKRIYLSWSEILEMADNGIEFGSHTINHFQLSSLTLEECEAELSRSKNIIEERIGRKVRALSYPFGGRQDFNFLVERAAIEAGYDCAFSLCQNGAYNSSFTIRRKIVDSHMSLGLSGKYCKPLFEADMLNLLRFK